MGRTENTPAWMKFQGSLVGIELDWSKLNAGAPSEVPSGNTSEAEAKDERLKKFFIINYGEKGLIHHDMPFYLCYNPAGG